jgi:large conductance mechanosensitive channel
MLKEFKKFAIQGNLIDIAVGLVMATAFGTVTSAFVDGVFLPLVGQVFQVGDMSQAKIVLSHAVIGANGKIESPESAILYGKVISSIINFTIIAFVMFIIIRIMNRLKPADPAPKGPSQEQLLTEIRDLLSKK